MAGTGALDVSTGGGNSALTACFQAFKQAFEDNLLDHLTSEQFRMVINNCQKLGSTVILPPVLAELADLLLQILASCQLSFDLQILGSTAFALVLNLIQEPLNISLLYSKILLPVEDKKEFSVKLTKKSELSLSVPRPEVFHICLTHGLLALPQSFWSSSHLSWNSLMYARLFPLFETLCFRFDTSLTLASYRCLVAWLRRVNSAGKPSRRVPPDVVRRCMNIVMSNWENPLNGIREQNSIVLEQLLLVLDSPIHQGGEEGIPFLKPRQLLDLVLTEQSWMAKRKYFLLSATLSRCGTLKMLLHYTDDIIHGLLTSLSYSHLAPAGADLYRVCLDALTVDQWQELFLQPIVNVLTSSPFTLQKQNVFNYWLQPTLRKYKSTLELILDAVLLHKDTHDVTLSVISCLKIGRKEGCENMQWPSIFQNPYLTAALSHSDELIRSHAFATVCHSSKSTVAPTDDEFQAVESFLKDNINSDSTPLRHNLLSSFTVFLCRIRDACLHALKTKYRHNEIGPLEDRALTRSMIFLEWLYNFLKENLEIGSNYQRKICSLETYKVILSHLSTDTGIPGQHRRNSLKSEGNKVMKYAIAVGKWSFTSDPSREVLLFCVSDTATDVREAAGFILTTYFKVSDHESARFSDLYKKAMQLCSDSMFYYAESGALLIHVLACLAYKNGGVKSLNLSGKEEKVVTTLISLAEAQLVEINQDLLKAATQGSPLHGVLRAIMRLATDRGSPEHNKLTDNELLKLILVLENAVTHCLSLLASESETSESAPSFCDMGKAIESAVKNSSIKLEEKDTHQLSSAYQLVLNCIWLNLKVSCQLASALVNSITPLCLGPEETTRCIQLCAKVLRGCRHKGAIESAAGSVGSIVKSLTARNNGSETMCCIVKAILNEAIDRMFVPSPLGIYTSRGAGNVLLVHRIVANDSRPNAPFLHSTVTRLLEALPDANSSLDKPQALHLFSVLIEDSSLSQEMARYTHQVALVCFDALSQPAWDVRNAGLQLFGSLVPKLIGQRKRQDDDTVCSCYHLSYEDLYYHSEALVVNLADQLDVCLRNENEDSLLSHSQLVPTLTLLSNLSVGLLTIIDRTLEKIFHRFIDGTQRLMSSRIHQVRRLAAKANAWFCSTSQLGSLIQTRVWKIVAYIEDRTVQNEIKSENELHGFLLNTKYLVERFQEEIEGNIALRSQKDLVAQSMKELRSVKQRSAPMSFVCRTILCQLAGLGDSQPAPAQLHELLTEVASPFPLPHSIGLPLWASTQVEVLVANCPDQHLLSLTSSCLNSDCRDVHIGCFKALSERSMDNSLVCGVVSILFQFLAHENGSEILSTILQLLEIHSVANISLDFEAATSRLLLDIFPLSSSVPVLCFLLTQMPRVNKTELEEVLARLNLLCSPIADEHGRLSAAKGLAYLANLLPRIKSKDFNSAKSSMWQTAVVLLQDEEHIVRTTASRFVTSVAGSSSPWNPHVSLNYMFTTQTLESLLVPGSLVSVLWSFLTVSPEQANVLSNPDSSLNPFDLGVRNIYQEPCKQAELAYSSLINTLNENPDYGKLLIDQDVVPNLKHLQEHCISFLKFTSEEAAINGSMVASDWYIVAKKIGFQCKIINFINNHSSSGDFDKFQNTFQSYMNQVHFLL